MGRWQARLRSGLTDESLRFAILAGLATVPLTVALSWWEDLPPQATEGLAAGGSLSLEVLLVAGLVVGYRYSGRLTNSVRAGLWTGLAASLGPAFVFFVNTLAPLWSDAGRFHAVEFVYLPIITALGVVLTVVPTLVVVLIAAVVTRVIGIAGRTTDMSTADE